MPELIPGLELSRAFYREAVEPIIKTHVPCLQYAAARLGHGSEVLGLDDAMSRDHDWGPRLTLFLLDEELDEYKSPLDRALKENLPHTFRGYSTHWSLPHEDHTWQLIEHVDGALNHRVEITSVRTFILDYLGFDITGELQAADWLTFPQQKLLGITSGEVFYDGIELKAVREYFSWYPHAVWLYLLASTWQRIGQEEHLMGRAGEAGSEMGSALIAARLVRDIMRLCFLMEKRYAPYAKWFGLAFSQLRSSSELTPILEKVLRAKSWQARDQWLAKAYAISVKMFNALEIIPAVPDRTTSFHNRPFRVIWGDRIASLVLQQVKDPGIQYIARRSPIGGIDLFSDNTDLLEDAAFQKVLRTLFRV
jgi:hypothetical protein